MSLVNDEKMKSPLLMIFATSGTGKSHLVKRFPDRFVDADELVYYDDISRELFEQQRIGELNELYRKRLGGYDGNKIILSSVYVHLPEDRIVFHRLIRPTKKYWKQDNNLNEIQLKYHNI